jgi:hypothetical protein
MEHGSNAKTSVKKTVLRRGRYLVDFCVQRDSVADLAVACPCRVSSVAVWFEKGAPHDHPALKGVSVKRAIPSAKTIDIGMGAD